MSGVKYLFTPQNIFFGFEPQNESCINAIAKSISLCGKKTYATYRSSTSGPNSKLKEVSTVI